MRDNDTPVILTDPARELAELFASMKEGGHGVSGAQHIAKLFEVEPWTADFHRVIAAILDRISYLEPILLELPLDPDIRQDLASNLHNMSESLNFSSMVNEWTSNGARLLGAENLQPLRTASGQVRQLISYPKLTSDDRDQLIEEISTLEMWLEEHQIVDQEFIRQALIEGLGNLKFRLIRLNWLGRGYVLDSLREVIAAYMLLERQGVTPALNPDAAAVLEKVGDLAKLMYGKLVKAKGLAETADWALKAYGAVALVTSGIPQISGLLPPPN